MAKKKPSRLPKGNMVKQWSPINDRWDVYITKDEKLASKIASIYGINHQSLTIATMITLLPKILKALRLFKRWDKSSDLDKAKLIRMINEILREI